MQSVDNLAGAYARIARDPGWMPIDNGGPPASINRSSTWTRSAPANPDRLHAPRSESGRRGRPSPSAARYVDERVSIGLADSDHGQHAVNGIDIGSEFELRAD